MAQLPPPADMSHNWSSPRFPHHRLPLPPPQSQQPSWVDEFLEFSSLRRSAHRRSASDSIAFLEAGGPLDMSRDRDNGDGDGDGEFDRLDDEQLMSMFTNDFSSAAPPTLLASSPSTPSDQNSNIEEKPAAPPQHVPKSELVEVESEGPQPDKSSPPANSDLIVDPKRVKRILANRQSAQRSRVRKLQYISELERSVTTLQTEVSALSPRVAFLDHQRLILNVDNSALKQRIAALAQDKIFKDAHQEALKKEIERLRQVYNHQQSMEKMRTAANNNGKQQQSEDTDKDKNSFSNSNDKNPEMKN